jgi:uncharacterized protein (DUF427 family)
MATRIADLLNGRLAEFRYEPVRKRVRASLDGVPVLDTTAAVLVWEPGRVVPQYAVPVTDVMALVEPAGPEAGDRSGPGPQPLGPAGVSVLTPATGFGVHTTDGDALTVRAGSTERPGAAFRPADPDLDGYVCVDFAAFDWDEPIVSHPRDPFHRVDVRRSSRHVRIELEGQLLAESSRPWLLFETNLPTRYYLPADDADAGLLRPSATTTACAYKGVAAYRDVVLPSRTVPDLAWTYPDPLPDATQVTGLIAFFTERLDVTVDGVAQPRPVSPWS